VLYGIAWAASGVVVLTWEFHHVRAFPCRVRIYQKSQENHQKRSNTDTRNGRAQKKPRIQKQSQEKLTLSKLKSKKVNLGPNKVNSTKGQIPNVSFQSLQVSNVTQMALEVLMGLKP
ncbi:hypothetical protein Tco_0076213, partial [Tanacetum coccineum]